jgi:hypothetical protein
MIRQRIRAEHDEGQREPDRPWPFDAASTSSAKWLYHLGIV